MAANSALRPMLAEPTSSVPTGPEWVHEVKWDGMRVLAEIHDGELSLTARSGRDVTVAFPELARLADTYDDALLDAEVVVLEGGRPSFGALADRMHVADATKAARLAAQQPVTLMVFDLLRLLGTDLTAQPWTARRALLEQLDLGGPHWQVPPTYDDGRALFAATLERGLEGVVSKRRTSAYASGRRSPDWLKSPHRQRVSAVVGGWRPEVGTERLGAVLLGLPAEGGFRFAGRLGSGLAGRAGEHLKALLVRDEVSESPFIDPVPSLDADTARWVHPRVVIEVESLGHSDGGRLRQPTYQGIRTDLTEEDLRHG